MTTEQWQKVKEVYDELAACEPTKRAARLEVLCQHDRAVHTEVEQLLEVQRRAGDFLESPPQLEFTRDQAGKQIGAYQLLREIGRGGMGTVYLAERADDVHRKPVAIKLVWPGYDSAEIFNRFRQERHILAELDHPNIARLLDGGTTDEGWPYVVMEYVAGEPITHYCNQRKLSVTERLQLFQQVCAAVSYAHRNLVVHRDLKPSNILVTRDGVAKLLDFGIAKILDPALRPEALSLTNTGLQAMTPEYASPEQARGETITTTTDVYSLGVMLYELLTGHQPYRFSWRTLHEVLRVIAEQEPLRPSQVSQSGSVPRAVASGLDTEIASPTVTASGTEPTTFNNAQENTPDKLRRRLQGDLDNITLKALRKEPEHRYSSVELFAEDIANHLEGKPVIARTPTVTYRINKFVRRNKVSVAFAAFVVMVLVASIIFVGRQWRTDGARARENLHAQYAARMNQAVQERENFNVEGIREAVETYLPKPGEEDLRGFEWRYLWRWGNRNLLTLTHNVPNGDGTRAYFIKNDTVAITQGNGYTDGIFKVWNAETGKLLSELPRGPNLPRSVLCGDEAGNVVQEIEKQSFKIWQPDTGKEIASVTHNLSPITRCNLDMSDPRRRLFTASEDGTIAAWEMTGKLLFSFKTSVPITFLVAEPKRERLIVSVDDKRLELWNLATRRLISSFDDLVPFQVNSLDDAFGSFILSPNQTRVAIWHDWLTGHELHRFEFDSSFGGKFYFRGKRLFNYGTSASVQVRDFVTGHRIAELNGHQEFIHSLTVNPQETIAATAGADRTVRLWDLQTYKQLGVIPAHDREVMSVSFSNDGRKLITGSQDRAAKIWDVASLLVPDKLEGHTDHVLSVAFSPDSRRLATTGQDRTVKLWDADTGKLLHTMTGHQHDIFTVAFSPSGDRIATGSEDLTVIIWDANTGAQLCELNHFTRRPRAVAFSPDGKLLAIGCDYRDTINTDDRMIRILDATSYRELAIFRGHKDDVVSLDFSPDGKTLASGSWDGAVKLWDVATGLELATLRGHTDSVWSVRFSPNGRRLATGSKDRSVKLWDSATARELQTMKTHSDEVFSVAFSPDGRRLASASNDHTVKLWDTATGRDLATFRDHADQVWSVAFSPDGRTLASGSWDKTVRLYRAATEQEVQARLPRQASAKK